MRVQFSDDGHSLWIVVVLEAENGKTNPSQAGGSQEKLQITMTKEAEVEHQFFSDAEQPEVTEKKAAAAVSKAEKKGKGKKPEQGPKKRYLAFIGNLPYSIEKGDLEKLFSDLGIIKRLLTHILMYFRGDVYSPAHGQGDGEAARHRLCRVP